LFLLLISTLLVLFYAFFVPSLGHLQEFNFREGVVNLDHFMVWGMVLSAVLIGILHQCGEMVGPPKTLSRSGVKPVLFFLALWIERTVYIVQQGGSLVILIPFFLSLIWILLFLKGTMVLSRGVGTTEAHESSPVGTEWGPLFFWTAVFFSFSIQLVLNGYGNWGALQALMFLGLSYLEYRKIPSMGILPPLATIGLQWAFRSATFLYSLILLTRFLRYL
jgi:hypothetical protein